MNTAKVTNEVISSHKVEGTTVYNQHGDKLGSIDALMMVLGIGSNRYPVP